MNLARMRALVREALGDRVGDFTDGVVDENMNRIWQFGIPDRVDGTLRQAELVFPTKNGQDTYDLDKAEDVGDEWAGLVREIQEDRGIRIDDQLRPLDYYTSHNRFYDRYRHLEPTQSQSMPQSVLRRGRTLTFRPVPNDAYNIVVPCTAYNARLTSEGLPNDNHAMAVVRGAVREIALEQGYEDIATRYAAMYDGALVTIGRQSKARPQTNPARRDF